MNKWIMLLLLLFLIICAVAVSMTKNLLTSLIIYMAFSLVMSIIWIILQSPDLAITEAAVGAGVTSILFFVTLKKIHAIDVQKSTRKDMPQVSKSISEGMSMGMPVSKSEDKGFAKNLGALPAEKDWSDGTDTDAKVKSKKRGRRRYEQAKKGL